MDWSLVTLRRLVNVQENSGSWFHQQIAFEAAVLAALVFNLSNGLATFFQYQVSHLLRVEQSLLKIRQMITNPEEDRVHLRLLSDTFDGLDEIKRRLDGVDAKFKLRDHEWKKGLKSLSQGKRELAANEAALLAKLAVSDGSHETTVRDGNTRTIYAKTFRKGPKHQDVEVIVDTINGYAWNLMVKGGSADAIR